MWFINPAIRFGHTWSLNPHFSPFLGGEDVAGHGDNGDREDQKYAIIIG